MDFLRSFLRRHLPGKLVVASPNVGCFPRLFLLPIFPSGSEIQSNLHGRPALVSDRQSKIPKFCQSMPYNWSKRTSPESDRDHFLGLTVNDFHFFFYLLVCDHLTHSLITIFAVCRYLEYKKTFSDNMDLHIS